MSLLSYLYNAMIYIAIAVQYNKWLETSNVITVVKVLSEIVNSLT